MANYSSEAEREKQPDYPILHRNNEIDSSQSVTIVANKTFSDDEQCLSDSLSLLKDTLPGFKSTLSPAADDSQLVKDKYEQLIDNCDREVVPVTIANLETPNQKALFVVQDESTSDSSDIDEDALSIIIAVEGEEDEEEEEKRMEDMEISINDGDKGLIRDSPPCLTDSNNVRLLSGDRMTVLAPLERQSMSVINRGTGNGGSVSPTRDPKLNQTTDISSDSKLTAAQQSKQSAKIKQFFTTLQSFGNKTSHEIAEQVQELITALVVRIILLY